MKEILIIEDERILRKSYAKLLENEGFATRTAKDGEEGIALFSEKKPDLVLLDVMMPRLNGFAVCEKIRALSPETPIVFLTALNDETDKCCGFGAGADDYIGKTESAVPRYLALRVKSLFERIAVYRTQTKSNRWLQLGDISVDFSEAVVRGIDFQERLTKTENDILGLLAAERGRILSVDRMLDELSDITTAIFLRSHVKNLRRKLGPAGCYIENIWGQGYRLIK